MASFFYLLFLRRKGIASRNLPILFLAETEKNEVETEEWGGETGKEYG